LSFPLTSYFFPFLSCERSFSRFSVDLRSTPPTVVEPDCCSRLPPAPHHAGNSLSSNWREKESKGKGYVKVEKKKKKKKNRSGRRRRAESIRGRLGSERRISWIWSNSIDIPILNQLLKEKSGQFRSGNLIITGAVSPFLPSSWGMITVSCFEGSLSGKRPIRARKLWRASHTITITFSGSINIWKCLTIRGPMWKFSVIVRFWDASESFLHFLISDDLDLLFGRLRSIGYLTS
jgi:hypothetical protein